MGIGLIAASRPLHALTGLPASLLVWAGILLLPIAAFMAVSARLAPIPRWAANVVIFGNVAWVLASLALPLTGLVAPNALGWILLFGQAGFVAVLAIAEFRAGTLRFVAEPRSH